MCNKYLQDGNINALNTAVNTECSNYNYFSTIVRMQGKNPAAYCNAAMRK